MKNVLYRCLFFDSRGCPIRKQMEITDEKLKENTIISEDWNYDRDQGVEREYEWLAKKYKHNMADWLVNNFCRICPHREA